MMNEFVQGLGYIILNDIVANLHFWCLRKMIYKGFGMKIGDNSRILRKVIVLSPKNIVIGNNVCINEFCYLDGRGGITIGDNTSVSVYTHINTGSHAIKDPDFFYIKKNVFIGKNVFTGAHSIILGGSIINDGVVVAAGSVTKGGQYKRNGIYSGVPAMQIGERPNEALNYDLGEWRPWFR